MPTLTLFAVEIAPGLFKVLCPWCGQPHYLTGLGHQFGLCWQATPFSEHGAVLVARDTRRAA